MYIASVQFSNIVRVCATTPPKAKCSKDCCDVSLIDCNALQVRGVDLMSRTSGVLSGVHTEADIDQSLEAFDGAIKAMMEEGLITHR